MRESTRRAIESYRVGKRLVSRVKCADPKRRKRLESDTPAWLRWYLPNAYTRPFEDAHLEIIEAAMSAHTFHERLAVAAERGIGKSTLLWGLVLRLALSGDEKFPVCLPWADSALKRALRFWKTALSHNERLAADYPEICAPFAKSQGNVQKLIPLVWEDTLAPTGAQLRISEGMIVFPDSRGVMGGATINGNPRGLNHPCDDGGVLRPTLAFIDDPQSRDVAKSAGQVQSTIELIDSDVAGIGDSDEELPILMSGNCIMPDDVMHHYLNDPGWNSVHVPRITCWPVDFDDKKSVTRTLWDDWNRLRLDGISAKDGGKAARAFYRKNKKAMVQGLTVSNQMLPAKGRKKKDALLGAMETYYVMGHTAFWAERQQKPVRALSSQYDLTTQGILEHVSGMPRLHASEGSVLTMGIDINYVGFNWTIAAADPMTSATRLVAHGLWPATGGMIPARSTDQQACQIIRRCMARFTVEVMVPTRVKCGTSMRQVECAGWDASNGKWQDAIAAAIKEIHSPIKQLAIKAFGVKTYRPRRTDIRQGKGWHMTNFPRIGRVLVINADLWRETLQRGFIVETSEPGAVSLYEPDTDGQNLVLAREIAGERLVEKVVTDRGEYYNWVRTPGVLNDRADSAVYALALTGVEGIGEDKVNRSGGKARVVIGRPSRRF